MTSSWRMYTNISILEEKTTDGDCEEEMIATCTQSKVRIFKGNIFSILMYTQCWKTTKTIKQKLKVFQKCFCRILKIFQPIIISNEVGVTTKKENFCEPWFKWGGPTETWWRIIGKEFKNQGLTANTGCQLSSATPAPPLELSFIGTIFVAWNGRVGQLAAGDIASVWTSWVWFPHWALQFLSSLWVKCVSMCVNIC